MNEQSERRAVIVGLPIIKKLLAGEDVELESLRVSLIPDDALFNNRTPTMLLFGDDVTTAERIFQARALLKGGEMDSRTVRIERSTNNAATPATSRNGVERPRQ